VSSNNWDVTNYENWTPEEFPPGMCALAGGKASEYITGSWRSMRPLWDKEKCTNCLICWVNCPDSSIELVDGQMVGIDLDHCKGCGVCVTECRFEALRLLPEHCDEVKCSEGPVLDEAAQPSTMNPEV
jgi:pyruvate ferredoxin oxidoreductase delta subunit